MTGVATCWTRRFFSLVRNKRENVVPLPIGIFCCFIMNTVDRTSFIIERYLFSCLTGKYRTQISFSLFVALLYLWFFFVLFVVASLFSWSELSSQQCSEKHWPRITSVIIKKKRQIRLNPIQKESCHFVYIILWPSFIPRRITCLRQDVHGSELFSFLKYTFPFLE